MKSLSNIVEDNVYNIKYINEYETDENQEVFNDDETNDEFWINNI